MVQKSSLLMVLEVFFIEPTSIHFIKEIGRRIKLAPTAVRSSIKQLLKAGLVIKRKSKPFDGFIGNRDNDDFIFYKRVYNLYSLKGLSEFLISTYFPRLMVVFGSYSTGEDTESSDIDVLILSKTRKEIKLNWFEAKLERKIHVLVLDDFGRIEAGIKKKVMNGIVLHGGF